MGILKKYRAGYSQEGAQAYYNVRTGYSGSDIVTVPPYKDISGNTRNQLYNYVSEYPYRLFNTLGEYRNLTPVPMSIGLYESALGLTYDGSKTYYTSNEGTTEADMSGYSDGDTIADNVYYCTYDVEDYDIANGAVGGTKSISRAVTVGQKSTASSVTITIGNTTEAQIIVKTIKFRGQIYYSTASPFVCDVLKCAYYLDPSEYVIIPAGETGSVTVVLEFGETT